MFRTPRTSSHPPRSSARDRTLRVVVEALEGRQLMTASADQLVIIPAAPAATIQAGVTAKYTIEAEDAQGNIDTGFADQIHFASSDPNAILPLNKKLQGGTLSVSIVFTTAGPQKFTVDDVASKDIKATSPGVTVTPGAAVALTISAPANVAVGKAATVAVAAIDAYGNTVTTDNDKVSLVAKPANSTLAASLTLSNGTATTTVTFAAPGSKTIAVADPSAAGITGASAGIVAGQIIQGTVFLDPTASGKYASGDQILPNRVVYLDLKQDGHFDAGDPTATTDSKGHFQFATYAAGSAVVREDLTQDTSNRNVVDETIFQADGSIAIGAVPISAVVPLPVVPNPFGPTAATSASANYVESLYRSILGRDGGPAEITGWTTKMQAGTTQMQVATAILGSGEHLTDEVDDYYEHFLGHAPDPAGLQSWVGQLASGTLTELQVVEAILGSPEYLADHPVAVATSTTASSPTAFVPSLYLDVLGRQGGTAELAATDALITNGMTPALVAAQVVESSEAVDAIIASFDSAFLRSLSDPTAAVESASIQSHAQSPSAVATDLLTGQAYVALVGAMPVAKSATNTTTSATTPTSDPTWYSAHLTTPKIAATVQAAMLAHGQLTRRDMLNLFKQVERAGKLTSSEFNDLKTIVRNTTVVAMSPSVRNLATKLVLGSRANKTYGTDLLGNLKVNSSPAHLRKLVNKWFLGLDRPTPTSTSNGTDGNDPTITSYYYTRAAGPLFKGTPSYHQVQQGASGDCYFLSSLASLTLHSTEQTIRNMITDNKDGTFTVRFYDYNAKTNVATPDYVTVDRYLPVDANGYYAFANNNYQISSKQAPIWAPLIEKAYAQWTSEGHNLAIGSTTWNNSYDVNGIGAGSSAANGVIEALTGQSGYQLAAPSANIYSLPKVQFATVAAAFANGSNIVCSSTDVPKNVHVADDHDYAVVAVDAATQSITLYNPWGLAGGDEKINGKNVHIAGQITIPWSKFSGNYYMLAYRPSTLT